MKVVPVASGKGGVGKSSIAANVAVALAQSGKDVILVDLDLGGSNTHVHLGLKAAPRGLGAFIVSGHGSIGDLIITTPFAGLRFIPGDSGVPGMANINFQQKKMLIRQLLALDSDYLVLDLGAGTGINTVDFFLLSGEGILVSAPNMAATLTAYLFLKNAVFRIISSCFPKNSPGLRLMTSLRKDGVSMQRIYVAKLMEELKSVDPENYVRFESTLRLFRPRLVMNLLEEPKDAARAERLRKSVSQYLSVEMELLGAIFKDEAQGRALSGGLPVLVYKPESIMSQAIKRIAARILEAGSGPELRLANSEEIEATYRNAELEAEGDYSDKFESIGTLFAGGAISDGDLLETLRVMQYEVKQIRKENVFLKQKLSQAVEQGFKAL